MAQKTAPTPKQTPGRRRREPARPSWWTPAEAVKVDFQLRKDRRKKAKAARVSRKANR